MKVRAGNLQIIAQHGQIVLVRTLKTQCNWVDNVQKLKSSTLYRSRANCQNTVEIRPEWYKHHRTKNCPPSLPSPLFTPPFFRVGTLEENQCVYCGGARNINVEITCTVFGFYAVSHWTACNVEVSVRVVSLRSFLRSLRIKSRKNNWIGSGEAYLWQRKLWWQMCDTNDDTPS